MDDSGEDVYTTDAGYADNLFLNLRRKINGNDSNIEPQPPAE